MKQGIIRLAVILNHTLFIEDVDEAKIKKYGGEQAYITELYGEDVTWDYIKPYERVQYIGVKDEFDRDIEIPVKHY